MNECDTFLISRLRILIGCFILTVACALTYGFGLGKGDLRLCVASAAIEFSLVNRSPIAFMLTVLSSYIGKQL